MGLAEVRWASLCRLGLQPHRRTQRQALPPLDWPVCQLRQLLCTDAQALACKPQCPQQMAGQTLEFLNNSITRLSYAENPATSRITDRTNLVLVDCTPLRWLGRTDFGISVVGYPFFRPTRKSVKYNLSIFRREFIIVQQLTASGHCFFVG